MAHRGADPRMGVRPQPKVASMSFHKALEKQGAGMDLVLQEPLMVKSMVKLLQGHP